jgi:hypothetical protein
MRAANHNTINKNTHLAAVADIVVTGDRVHGNASGFSLHAQSSIRNCSNNSK